MKKIKELFSKLSGKVPVKEEQEFIEIEPEEVGRTAKVYVRYFVLNEFADIKPVIEALREGYTIALVKIRPLKEKDINELKRAIEKIKRTIQAIEGEVVGVDEDWLLAVPNFVEVYKGMPSEEEGE